MADILQTCNLQSQSSLFMILEDNVWTWGANCFCANEKIISVFISWVESNKGNKYQNNTQVIA